MITIRVISPEAYIIEAYAGQDNQVYLDTDIDLDLRYTKALEQLTEANQVTQEAALAFSVPMTRKNKALLKGKLDPIDIEARKDGKPLPGTKLEVIKEEDRIQRIEVEIFGAGWVTDLEKVFLRTLDIGDYDYTKANIETTWTQSSPLAIPGVAYYGGFNTPGDITRKDLRFWFNLYQLMSLAFCAIGWTFKSEYFEKAGAKIYGYLGGENWFSYPDKSDVFRVDLNLATPRALLGTAEVIIFDEVSDPLNIYDSSRPSEYLYPPAGENGIDLQIQIRSIKVTLDAAPAGDPVPKFYVIPYRNRPPNIEFLGYEEFSGPLEGTITLELSFTFNAVGTNAGDSFALFFTYQDENGTAYPYTMDEIDLVYSPDPPYYIDDDTIDLAGTIDQNINGLDLFKALAHICNGKIRTDETARTVELFPPFSVEQYTDNMDGFYKRDQPSIRIDNTMEVSSMTRTNTKNEADRYVELKFKDAGDSYIQELSLKKDPYSRTIDRGSGVAKTTKIENNLFEPTLEAEPSVGDTGTTSSATPLSLPALWDNTDGRISRELGPRIGYWYGEIEQLDGSGVAINWSWEGALRTLLPYITQAPVRPMASDPDIYPLIFADRQYDLWRLYYRRWLEEILGTRDIEVLAKIDYMTYNGLDFRTPIGFFYDKNYKIYQLINIKDFSTREDTATVLSLKLIGCPS